MYKFKRILAVSRMIQSSKKVIQCGVSLAHNYQAELYVIHSIYNPFGLRGWSIGTQSLEKEYEKILLDAKEKLSELVESETIKGLAIKELIREGEPSTEILKTIEQKNIDLLVMLAHKEGRMEDLFFDRSNDELIKKIPCSILLVKDEPGKG